jgi:iron(III) transport system permease protein
MGAVLVLLLLERALRGRRRWSGGEAVARPIARRPIEGGGRWLATLACAVPVLLGFGVPVFQFLWWSARTAAGELDGAFVRLALTAVGLAAAAAVIAVGAGLIIAWAVRLARSALTLGAARVAGLGYAMPGAVVAVGVLAPLSLLDLGLGGVVGAITGTPPGLLLGGTVAALLFAYLVRFLAVAHLPLEAGLAALPASMDDAARTLGASPRRLLRRVILPLLAGPLGAALLFVFVDVMKELPITLALRPFNVDTLATQAFQLAIDERPAQAAPYALAIILVGLVPVLLLDRLARRARG